MWAALYQRYFFCLIFFGVVLQIVTTEDVRAETWRTASRESVGIAPDPALTPEALIQVYGARAYSWRGYFGIHTWIAVKPTNAAAYTIYEVIGWRQRSNRRVLVKYDSPPDRRWYGNMPEVLAEKRGEGVDALIARIEDAARDYPYQREYTIWPGPNSNTFTAWVSRSIPELELDLPPTAIGKDYLGHSLIALAPSGRGIQLSLYGVFGVLASQVEGVEINLLGLTFGISSNPPAIKLPMAGRINLALGHL
ncbi:MAG: DUF3750 domain-containing protein [Nitrosomonas sp.]|nr:DUF3750 domain-containing protein [Nitrosomonas sp.]MDP1951211.1 DUF3750 domain-containing protein [Nitrosomonas sp.]